MVSVSVVSEIFHDLACVHDSFAAEAALLGEALNKSFAAPVAAWANVTSGGGGALCSNASVAVHIPTGAVVNAVGVSEDIAHGQAIAAYALEYCVLPHGTDTPGGVEPGCPHDADWVAVVGATHGQTVGAQVVDLLPAGVPGPALLRWRCTAAVPALALVRLRAFAAYTVAGPPGWAFLSATWWMLQTLYTPPTTDMTPCTVSASVLVCFYTSVHIDGRLC